ncbi:hypothetical protein OEV98_13820 [Caldibacillus lycopersici]|uniref:Uncharacterized protein n=1 Tax=Perspicuibacillus lycopersici TaxID=1325689 RepID=A0AAE3IUE4_9BACI|nr:hypothetical protein [Perspicuibacillus lycopersici]MCU9614617.1 hypothetical protein [Perspicuibacillus lycopersici]
MTKIKKTILFSALSAVVILVLLMTWIYPFSFFSINKSYSYEPNNNDIDKYVERLNELETLVANSPNNPTKIITENILGYFEQDWIVTKDSKIKITKDELELIKFHVKDVRGTLLDMTVQEDYSYETRSYLLATIESFLSFEEYIDELKKNSWETRSTIDRELDILHGGFFSNLITYINFFETEVSQSE